jgi:DNA invertase Pin-like site-specific DNA recombinase
MLRGSHTRACISPPYRGGGKLVFHIFGSMAEFERETLSGRERLQGLRQQEKGVGKADVLKPSLIKKFSKLGNSMQATRSRLQISVKGSYLKRRPLYQTLPAREALASSSRVAILSGQSGTWRRKKPWATLRSVPA